MAVVTKHTRLGGLNDRDLFFHILKTEKSKSKLLPVLLSLGLFSWTEGSHLIESPMFFPPNAKFSLLMAIAIN